MDSARVIKKYPNRRLYDTEESRYITLADVRDLVMNDVDFVVIDKKTGDDITRSILLQVISEQEQHGEPIMSEDFLSEIIRSYGTAVPDFMKTYLEQSLKMFLSQQDYMRGQVRKVVGVDPVTAMTDMTQQNMQRFMSMQQEVLNQFLGARSQQSDDEPESSGGQTKTG